MLVCVVFGLRVASLCSVRLVSVVSPLRCLLSFFFVQCDVFRFLIPDSW